jgi:hypothetical protein
MKINLRGVLLLMMLIGISFIASAATDNYTYDQLISLFDQRTTPPNNTVDNLTALQSLLSTAAGKAFFSPAQQGNLTANATTIGIEIATMNATAQAAAAQATLVTNFQTAITALPATTDFLGNMTAITALFANTQYNQASLASAAVSLMAKLTDLFNAKGTQTLANLEMFSTVLASAANMAYFTADQKTTIAGYKANLLPYMFVKTIAAKVASGTYAEKIVNLKTELGNANWTALTYDNIKTITP